MVVLGDKAQVEAYFGMFEDSANLKNHFGWTQWNS
jgi:hypothetical protein